MFNSSFFAKLTSTLALALVLSSAQAADHYQQISCGKLLDVENKKTLLDQQILVKNDLIVEIGDSVGAPAGAEKIDLSTQTCMPGLMDMHVHIGHDGSTNKTADVARISRSDADGALYGLHNVQNLLRQGFTTIRIPGGFGKSFYEGVCTGLDSGNGSDWRYYRQQHGQGGTGGTNS